MKSVKRSHILHSLLQRWGRAGMQVLEINCGTGEHSRILQDQGCQVVAIDPDLKTIEDAQTAGSKMGDLCAYAVSPFPVPPNHELYSRRFDAILGFGVLDEVSGHDLFDFAFHVRTLLKENGFFLCSFTSGDNAAVAGNSGGFSHEPAEVQLLFERIGFSLVAREMYPETEKGKRPWNILILGYSGGSGTRPIDQIESIINRDRKTATYKLALLRALCEIAQTSYRHARWHEGDLVSLPMGLVVEKWVLYYWPILSAEFFLPEITNKKLKFRCAFEKLMERFTKSGGLDAFYAAYLAGRFTSEEAALLVEVSNRVAEAIKDGPVFYSGGPTNRNQVFSQRGFRRLKEFRGLGDFHKAWGRLFMPSSLWREMTLVGHWIGQAIILRWAELSSELEGKNVPLPKILERLIISPNTDREVGDARNLYKNVSDLRCVWSDTPLRGGQFEVDHVIPFSLWHNNDLWNLLPTLPKINLSKRDKIVSRGTLRESEERVVFFWREGLAAFPGRFENEICRTLLGADFNRYNWEKQALTALHETVESVALQRGAERWDFSQPLRQRGVVIPKVPKEVFGTAGNSVQPRETCDRGPRIFSFPEIGDLAFEDYLPLVAEVAAGEMFDGFRTGSLRDVFQLPWVETPPGVARRSRFVVKVAGDSMEPLFWKGDYLVFEYHRTPRCDGEIVLAARFPSGSDAGEYAVKRFRADSDSWIFESENPRYQPIKIPRTDLHYPILGILVEKLKSGDLPN